MLFEEQSKDCECTEAADAREGLLYVTARHSDVDSLENVRELYKAILDNLKCREILTIGHFKTNLIPKI